MVGRCLVRGSYKKWTLHLVKFMFFLQRKSVSGTGYSLQKQNRGEAENDRFFFHQGSFSITGVHDIFGSQNLLGSEESKVDLMLRPLQLGRILRIWKIFCTKKPWPQTAKTSIIYVGKSLSESAVRSRWTGASVVSAVRCVGFCAWNLLWNLPLIFSCYLLIVWQGPLIVVWEGECLSLDVFSFI